tara:strand:+ start:599 stop:1672 length:1074 start_codon:yes stop_codon:yes gene_type:complete
MSLELKSFKEIREEIEDDEIHVFTEEDWNALTEEEREDFLDIEESVEGTFEAENGDIYWIIGGEEYIHVDGSGLISVDFDVTEANKIDRMVVTRADKRANSTAWKNYKKGDKRYTCNFEEVDAGDIDYADDFRALDEVRIGKPIKGKLGKTYPVMDASQKKKIVKIANKHSGNMKQAVKEIERIRKGLSDNPDVVDILRMANEDTDKSEPGTQGDEGEYQKKRKEIAAKFGVKSCSQLEGEEKKACYAALDAAHVSDDEEGDPVGKNEDLDEASKYKGRSRRQVHKTMIFKRRNRAKDRQKKLKMKVKRRKSTWKIKRKRNEIRRHKKFGGGDRSGRSGKIGAQRKRRGGRSITAKG